MNGAANGAVKGAAKGAAKGAVEGAVEGACADVERKGMAGVRLLLALTEVNSWEHTARQEHEIVQTLVPATKHKATEDMYGSV